MSKTVQSPGRVVLTITVESSGVDYSVETKLNRSIAMDTLEELGSWRRMMDEVVMSGVVDYLGRKMEQEVRESRKQGVQLRLL